MLISTQAFLAPPISPPLPGAWRTKHGGRGRFRVKRREGIRRRRREPWHVELRLPPRFLRLTPPPGGWGAVWLLAELMRAGRVFILHKEWAGVQSSLCNWRTVVTPLSGWLRGREGRGGDVGGPAVGPSRPRPAFAKGLENSFLKRFVLIYP